ncbi:MAG: NAD-dependent epimerase/dehydratase family protein, partial [Chloroflexota bacterium]
MRVFIAGIDGYLGWALAQYMTAEGHEVAGADKMLRRDWVAEVDSISAIPIASRKERLAAFEQQFGKSLDFREGDLTDYNFVRGFFEDFQPEAIVHLAQMPSAPYSMMDVEHAVWTHTNNVSNNLNILYAIKDVVPDAHLVKLGTMGEYGQPNVRIPEGFFEVEFMGRKDKLWFPRSAGSWYHQTKVHDSHNTWFATKIWGLRATDIMQGVVFGTQFPGLGDDPRLRTRLDFDQAFGTAINRFCAQAVAGHPITLYGSGTMTRAFLPLRDSMRCLTLAVENPADEGEFRVFNQFAESYSIRDLAHMVKEVGSELGLDVTIKHYDNPRVEKEQHYYEPIREGLDALGYEPTMDVKSEMRIMMTDLLEHQDLIKEKSHILVPDIRWDGSRERSEELETP